VLICNQHLLALDLKSSFTVEGVEDWLYSSARDFARENGWLKLNW
jgi:hypothetical protein